MTNNLIYNSFWIKWHLKTSKKKMALMMGYPISSPHKIDYVFSQMPNGINQSKIA